MDLEAAVESAGELAGVVWFGVLVGAGRVVQLEVPLEAVEEGWESWPLLPRSRPLVRFEAVAVPPTEDPTEWPWVWRAAAARSLARRAPLSLVPRLLPRE